MTFNETAVIVVGVFLGYWVIDALLNKKSAKITPNKPVGAQANTGAPVVATIDNDNREYEEYIAHNWYSILGVSADADKETIISAYQQLIAECHSENVFQRNDEPRQVITPKSKKIKDAYSFAMSRV